MALLSACGFTRDEMQAWHAEFERLAPEEHERFLHFLRIPEEEIALLRTWSTGAQTL
jgi:hypothetical protein